MSAADKEFDYVYVPSALGYGGMVIKDGIGRPMTDDEALRIAIPQWVTEVDDLAAIIALCLKGMESQSPDIRVVALTAFIQLAARRNDDSLSNNEEVKTAITSAITDADPAVRKAAEQALETLGQ